MNKIALGTVQFGMNYGISHTTGQIPFDEIARILHFCNKHGIDTIDTAQGYGESEKVLGQFNLSSFKVITKLIGAARLETSLENLKLDSIYGLMLHRENECNEHTWAQFESYKTRGMVKKIGVSVYSPELLNNLIDLYPIDIVQLPMNILDQRFIPILDKLKNKGIEVHIRSLFLQGLLLMKSIAEYISEIKAKIESIPSPRLEYALALGKQHKEVDKMVLGVTRLQDLEEIYNAYKEEVNTLDFSQYAVVDDK